MATYTTRFNLAKPALTDTADIAVINENMDDIDAAIPAVVDNLTSTSTTSALSANQGKVLKDADTTHVAESTAKHITESGSNSNGIYVKFDDGTAICRSGASLSATANTDITATWTYPITMTGTKVNLANIQSVATTNSFSVGKLFMTASSANTTDSVVRLNASATQVYVIGFISIGRWKT